MMVIKIIRGIASLTASIALLSSPLAVSASFAQDHSQIHQ
jgi:hypothetical protein